MTDPTAPTPPPASPRKPRRRWLIPLGTGIAGLLVGVAASSSSSAAPTAAAPTATATVTSTTAADRAAAPTVTQTITVKPRITATVRVTPAPASAFGDGVYLVGTDIPPGRYRTVAPVDGQDCYWEVVRSPSAPDAIIANDNPAGGRPTVTVKTGQQFESERCGDWGRG